MNGCHVFGLLILFALGTCSYVLHASPSCLEYKTRTYPCVRCIASEPHYCRTYDPNSTCQATTCTKWSDR